jgi:hypothetical protein
MTQLPVPFLKLAEVGMCKSLNPRSPKLVSFQFNGRVCLGTDRPLTVMVDHLLKRLIDEPANLLSWPNDEALASDIDSAISLLDQLRK